MELVSPKVHCLCKLYSDKQNLVSDTLSKLSIVHVVICIKPDGADVSMLIIGISLGTLLKLYTAVMLMAFIECHEAVIMCHCHMGYFEYSIMRHYISCWEVLCMVIICHKHYLISDFLFWRVCVVGACVCMVSDKKLC